jgi:hypothetical protein
MKLKTLSLTLAISISTLFNLTSKVEAQLAPLSMVANYKSEEDISFNIYIPSKYLSDKPYEGILSWLDVAFAQSYGIASDHCNAELGGYTRADNYKFVFRFYSKYDKQNVLERSHALSCGKARELAANYGLVAERRLHYGSNYNPYVSTLKLDTKPKIIKFKNLIQSTFKDK